MSTVKIFAEDVVEKIHRYLPGEYDSVQCEVKVVLKNNGIRMTGIEFQREGSSISQIIYLEPFFEDIRQGKETETVLKNIADSYIQNVSTECMAVINEQQLIDLESVRQSIEPVLVHTAENREMLGQMPHRKIADLSLYYKIVFQDQGNDMQASMNITNGHMKQWGVTEQELYHQAVTNMECRETNTLTPMGDVLASMFTGKGEERNLLTEGSVECAKLPQEGFYVLTNERRIYGAALLAVPGVMEKVDQLFPEGYYILPSSLHEVLIIEKDKNLSAKELGEMVREVNRAEVSPQERLSDCVYEYDREKATVRQVPESLRSREMER